MNLMETRRFGPGADEVAVIGQGTWQLRDHDAALDALTEGLRFGMTHIDTAELYTGSEQTIGRLWREEGVDRKDVFLVSKVKPMNASRAGTIAHCKASLQRLGVDHLDVYLLHWPGSHPLEDTMGAMAELIDDGLIRGAGVSNFDVAGMEAAQEALGGHALVCNQVLYHLEERNVEHEVLPYCARNDIALVGYSPFGSGRFPRRGSPGWNTLAAVGKKHERTPHQVALRFLTRESPMFTIPKAESMAHVRTNAGGQGWRLDREDLETIGAAFPLAEPRAGVPTL